VYPLKSTTAVIKSTSSSSFYLPSWQKVESRESWNWRY